MSRKKCNEIEPDYYLFRHFLNYFYGKSNWLFCIFACKSCQASVVKLVLRAVGTSPDLLSSGIDPGCPMGSRCWPRKQRQKWGRGASSSPGSSMLTFWNAAGQCGTCSWRTTNCNDFLRIFISCMCGLIGHWRSEGLILGYT